MGPDVVNEVFQRKGPKLTALRIAQVREKHSLSEMYLVLGGDPQGPRHSKQTAGDHLFVLHSLTHMQFLLDDFGCDGIVIFYDGGDHLSVFCSFCVHNYQAIHNWHSKKIGWPMVRHRCASLKLQGPIARTEKGDPRSEVSVAVADELNWIRTE